MAGTIGEQPALSYAHVARTGLLPEQFLAPLADRVRMNDNGTLNVDAFTPH
ncbi:hypothetical protein ABZT02_35065 [Streptomyces sp. NPDC005402]|uniref:hypothetical protein n=1 Tax=Streptomyces sp. NPDC005402 TaxID=3155338 RepID=UPI00339FE38D